MGIRGTLTKDTLGFSMPSDAPLYPRPPYHYQDASLMIFNYVTDGPSAARLLPAEAELADPPTAGLVFASYPSSTLGPYQEVVVFLNALYQGREVKYAAYLYVTTDVAMAAGREMGGFPKKIAAIDFHAHNDQGYHATLRRPAGLCLATGHLRLVRQLQDNFSTTLNYLTLRLIPSPTKDAPPSMAELVETDWVVNNGVAWEGSGSCQITGASASDPLQVVPVVNLLGCELIRGDLKVSANDTPRSHPLSGT
jgi:acetoacetate decarboxylase